MPDRIPTLDGWRGIAILLVLFDHFQPALLGGYPAEWSRSGAHGVTIFFVLSGYLITSKLIAEPMNLRQFYIRRFFRLMPATWVFLGFLALLAATVNSYFISGRLLASCLFFYRDLLLDGGYTQHFWSLSLEEQFYLTWPFVLLLAGARRSSWIAVVGIAACAIYRGINWQTYYRPNFCLLGWVRVDAILVGCLLALFLKDNTFRERAQRWTRIAWAPALAVFVFCAARAQAIPPLWESLAISVLIAGSSLNPASAPAALLSFRPLVWLGTISYSAYLWQQIFTIPLPSPMNIVMIFVLFPAFVLFSYYCIERPFTRMGRNVSSEGRSAIQASVSA